jgi:hypothetical protein
LIQLTEKRRTLLKKLQVPQVDEKVPAFYGTVNVHHRTHNSPPLLPILIYEVIFIYSKRTGQVCGRSPAENVGSNPIVSMDVCLL